MDAPTRPAPAPLPGLRDLRPTFDAEVQRAVRPVLAAAASIYAAFAVLDVFVFPPAMAAADAAAALVLAAAWFVTGRFEVPARWAHAAMSAVALLVVVEGGFSLLYLRDPLQTVGFILLAVGAGVFLLDARWLALVLGGALGTWGGVAAAVGLDVEWAEFGMTLVSTCLLAAVVNALRVRTLARLETHRRAEARRAAELEVALEAARRSEEALEESREKYRSIVENAPNFIMTVARDGTILYINRTQPGVRPEDVVGRTIYAFAGEEEREKQREALRRVFEDGEPAHFEILSAGPHGEPAWYESHVAPVRKGGVVDHAMMVNVDITERRKAEEAQRVAFERLVEIDRLKEQGEFKTRLLNTASHELNTPITPLKLQVHLLKSGRLGDLNERQARAVDMLDRNIGRLSTLVQDVLDVARLQSGRLRLRRATIDLVAIATEAIEAYEETARQAGVRLESDLHDVPRLEADPDRVTQVLFNLIGNAIKFTPAGGTVAVEVARERERAVVRVRDTGVGLTPEQIARLFQPFGQVHDTDARTYAGTGLGLYISRGIVEQHGGRIWAESPGEGAGSTFSFALPLDGRAAAREAPSDVVPAEPN